MRRLVMLLVVGAAACGPPSIESLCEEAAEGQCDACYSCPSDGAKLCQMPSGFDEEECRSELTGRCVDQAATLERPKREVESCNDSVGRVTCEQLTNGLAQDTPYTTPECSYFL